MGRRATSLHPWTNQPGCLIGHEDPYDIWNKLRWEVAQFSALEASEPPLDADGMVYLMQSACISAVAAVEWLEKAGKRLARDERAECKSDAFGQAVAWNIPDLHLARAITNTLKHATYRDEGWIDAEIRLQPLFTAEQRSRLDAIAADEEFNAAFADEAARAGFRISFAGSRDHREVHADSFLSGLSDGVLRLLDASDGGQEYMARKGDGR